MFQLKLICLLKDLAFKDFIGNENDTFF